MYLPRQTRSLCGLYFEWAELYLPRQNRQNCTGQDSHVPYVGSILNGQNYICQDRIAELYLPRQSGQNCIGQDSHVPYVGSILNGQNFICKDRIGRMVLAKKTTELMVALFRKGRIVFHTTVYAKFYCPNIIR